MELEEAIKILNNMRSWDCREPNSKCVEAIEIALSELDSLKFKYQVRKDRTDTIITKQEKMIELLIKHICDVIDNDDGACLLPFYDNDENLEEKVRQYFEKKAEESDKNVDD